MRHPSQAALFLLSHHQQIKGEAFILRMLCTDWRVVFVLPMGISSEFPKLLYQPHNFGI